MKSVALANQKGGVGKTTTAIHLAHGLALIGKRVALLDMDPQGHATLAVKGMVAPVPDPPAPAFTEFRALADGFWILPSTGPGTRPGDSKVDMDRFVSLAEGLDRAEIDWLVVDCPPRMDEWGWAGVRLCQEVLIPVQAEFLAKHGLTQMMRALESARKESPSRSALLGVLVTMLDEQESVEMEVLGTLREDLGSELLDTVVYRDTQLVEAASHGLTLYQYNPFSKGARSYGELVREVVHGRAKVG